MDDQDRDSGEELWADMLAGIAAIWSGNEPRPEAKPQDDGERYLIAARIVSRGT